MKKDKSDFFPVWWVIFSSVDLGNFISIAGRLMVHKTTHHIKLICSDINICFCHFRQPIRRQQVCALEPAGLHAADDEGLYPDGHGAGARLADGIHARWLDGQDHHQTHTEHHALARQDLPHHESSAHKLQVYVYMFGDTIFLHVTAQTLYKCTPPHRLQVYIWRYRIPPCKRTDPQKVHPPINSRYMFGCTVFLHVTAQTPYNCIPPPP